MSKHRNAEARAAARRRGRQAAREQAERIERGEALQETCPTPAPQMVETQATQGGLGVRAAFRGSLRSAPIRDDLRQLPSLVKTRALMVPLVVIAVTTGVALQQGALSSSLVQLAVQSILLPPAFVVAFLAGMLTRRASWLLGGLLGLVSYAGALVIGSVGDLAVLEPTNPVRMFLERNVENSRDLGTLVGDLYGVAVSGIFAGAFAGWYGRFLRAMSPSRRSSRDQRRK
jgi:hypothetical protein